mgnify:CR=1 FL=1
MTRSALRAIPLVAVAVALLAGAALAADQTKPAVLPTGPAPALEPKAVDVLKAASARLAGAQTMSFNATAEYESPSRLGPPLVYTTLSEVTLQRPDKLRVITPGDGPASEFYYDGKTVMAYTPSADMVAIAEAPPTIDEMLHAAYHYAAIYFPFTDVIVADPWADLSQRLRLAFVVGRSVVLDDIKTDIVVIADDNAQAQIWVGAEDHLPRMIRATFFNEPGNFRHTAVFSDWRINPKIPAGAFTSKKAAQAKHIPFAPPG